ncbi:GGDEF domain-containing protein [Lysobacter silvisoli]|uniref:Sensor domain-containing diguanylate cyclase n=1 Tax=Lysobacter silvisoli TaxID=2293254 RepID=A0A371K1G9_9GAMM|nr:sensor domain-containing diguanylate cyclase [Lysobacter silvisoli]RDZ27755.1 sensor domain-containing diguanylate cyclase [Lysobacter silvisoli]
MIKPSTPDNESERLAALQRYAILDTPPETAFDDLVAIAGAICATPMSTVSLIDTDRQWFKGRRGIEAEQTPRDHAFCAHAILEPEKVMVVPDARDDARFSDNPLVTGNPNIRFYAGAPLVTPDGYALGTLCVLDDEPRELAPYQVRALEALSRQVSHLLELRRVSRELNHQLTERNWYEQQLKRYQQELEAQNADLTEQTRTDALTGLANRRAFNVALEQALQAGREVAVAVVDVDHFKVVNDVHGHATGDEVLRDVAGVLRATGAASGLVARYGGEEFVWLIYDRALADAALQCEYLRQAVAHATQTLAVTVSVGVAVAQDGDSAERLFARADQALYAAKRGGRNRVVASED